MEHKSDRCPQCKGSETYPMLVGDLMANRALCANPFHEKWRDFAFNPTLWKLIKRWFEGW